MGSAATATGGAALAEGALAVEGGAAPLLLVAGRPLGPLTFFTVVSLAGSTSPSSGTGISPEMHNLVRHLPKVTTVRLHMVQFRYRDWGKMLGKYTVLYWRVSGHNIFSTDSGFWS